MENQNNLNSIDPQQQTPKPAYNPLMDVVSEKPYSVQNVAVDQNQLSSGIPEPTYQPQSIGGRQNPYKTIRDGGSMMGAGADDSDKKSSSVNPSMNEIPDAEKKEGAKHLAKIAIDGYEQLHVFGNMALQFNQRKLRKLELDGEIDLSIPIPDGYGNTVTAGNFIEEFNEQTKDTLTVSPQFKKEVMPLLEKEFADSGAGLTNRQMLIYLFGKDIAVKGVLFYQMKGQMSDMIEIIKEQTQAYKDGNGVKSKPKNDNKTYNDKTTQSYAYAPTPSVDTDASDFNFQMNETVMSSTVQQMEIPKTGKERVIEQRAKEKKWKQDSENVSKPSSYQEAMAQRKTGKRGRKKTISDYVNGVDKEAVVESIILTETKDNEDNLKD